MDESHGHHGGGTCVLFGYSCYCDHVMYLLRLCFGVRTMTSDYGLCACSICDICDLYDICVSLFLLFLITFLVVL